MRSAEAPKARFITSDNRDEWGCALAKYLADLERAPLSDASRRSYAGHVTRFLCWLRDNSAAHSGALTDPHERDYAVRDYRRWLLSERRLGPASVNAALAGIDDLYRRIGLGPALAYRERLPQAAPRALSEDELRRLFRTAERSCNARDRAVLALLALAGLRLGELAALDLDDLALSARHGKVRIRNGKGGRYREVPLAPQARDSVRSWLAMRGDLDTAALFPGPTGRLTTRSIDRIVRRIGDEAHVALSPHVLRHSWATRLVRAGHDLVLVAELAGHSRLETTRRYSLPTAADRDRAISAAEVDY